MPIQQLNQKQWEKIINTYFSGYCMSAQTQIKRRAYRNLYLANQDYLRNLHLTTPQYPNNEINRLIQLNNWYLNYYNKYVPLNKGINIIPCKPNQ